MMSSRVLQGSHMRDGKGAPARHPTFEKRRRAFVRHRNADHVPQPPVVLAIDHPPCLHMETRHRGPEIEILTQAVRKTRSCQPRDLPHVARSLQPVLQNSY